MTETEEYKFTQSWFDAGEQVWPQIVPLMNQRQRVLEVGSFEGRSSVWIVEHMLEDGGLLRCVDNWQGSEEHKDVPMDAAEKLFDHNIQLAVKNFPKRRVHKFKGNSTEMLSSMVASESGDYDFIYIDGSHTAPDVMSDIVMAWPLLKVGGIMVFDDYLWGDARDVLHKPKISIDAFVTIYGESLSIVHMGYQFAVTKTK